MHIAILGVGAVGGYYGSQLELWARQHPEHRVSFIARGVTYETLRENGLKLIQPEEGTELVLKDLDLYVTYADLPSKPDVVLLCTKSRNTEELARELKLEAPTYIVSVQNGLENEEILAKYLGAENVVGCITNIAAENREPGVYIQKGKYNIVFGEIASAVPRNDEGVPRNDEGVPVIANEVKQSHRLKQLVMLMKQAGINAQISNDIRVDMWSKIVWNAAFNPISALHELEIGPLIADPQHRASIQGIMTEVKELALAQGIAVDPEIDRKQFERTDVPAWQSFKTSMLQDTLAGKPIELEEILGVILRKARELGIPAPNAESIYNECKRKFV